MSNRNNPRTGDKRHTEHGRQAHSCAGEGANGARGRTKWKRIRARMERNGKAGKIEEEE